MSDVAQLTAAQCDALAVLVMADKPVRGGKRRSTLTPVPHVNSTAAFSLVKMGLARQHMIPHASVFTSGWEFTPTDRGRQEHQRTAVADG